MQQAIHTINEPVHATLTMPGSKSLTNRALLLAALANGTSTIAGLSLCDDTRALMKALIQLGVRVQLDESTRSCIVDGCNGQFPNKQAAIWCEEAGTVIRFL